MKKIVLAFTLLLAMSIVSQAQSITLKPTNVFNTEISTIKKDGIGFSHESSGVGGPKVGTFVWASGAFIQTHTNHSLNFATNNGETQMTLRTNGRLGIASQTLLLHFMWQVLQI